MLHEYASQIKVGAMGFLATMTAAMAAPSGEDISAFGVGHILAEKYPFILLSIVFVYLLLKFLRENSDSAAKREQILFDQFDEIRKADREALLQMQTMYFQQLQAVSTQIQGSNDKILGALERILANDLVEASERKQLQGLLDNISRAAKST